MFKPIFAAALTMFVALTGMTATAQTLATLP